MFEKEAEEYTNNLLKDVNCNIGNPRARQINSIDVEEAYQNGAEFGYNKANEWHYPSKGELPKCDEKTQLIFYVTCYYGDITRKRMVLGYYQKSFINDDVKLFVEKSKGYEEEHLPKDVIAWKEIVLPKESE